MKRYSLQTQQHQKQSFNKHTAPRKLAQQEQAQLVLERAPAQTTMMYFGNHVVTKVDAESVFASLAEQRLCFFVCVDFVRLDYETALSTVEQRRDAFEGIFKDRSLSLLHSAIVVKQVAGPEGFMVPSHLEDDGQTVRPVPEDRVPVCIYKVVLDLSKVATGKKGEKGGAEMPEITEQDVAKHKNELAKLATEKLRQQVFLITGCNDSVLGYNFCFADPEEDAAAEFADVLAPVIDECFENKAGEFREDLAKQAAARTAQAQSILAKEQTAERKKQADAASARGQEEEQAREEEEDKADLRRGAARAPAQPKGRRNAPRVPNKELRDLLMQLTPAERKLIAAFSTSAFAPPDVVGYFNAVAHALAYRYGFAQGYSYFNTQPANSVGFFRELTEFELSNTRRNQRAFETSWGLNVPLYSTAPVEERVDVISEMLKNEQKEQAKPLDSVGKLIRVAGNIPDGTQLLVSATARATNISEASLSNKNRIATVRSNFKRLAGYE